MIWTLLFLASLVLFAGWYRNGKTGWGAPYEGMDGKVVERVIRMAGVGADDVVYDLGSGEGRVVIGAVLTGARAVGIEIDKLRVWYSRIWVKALGLSGKVKIVHGDVFKEDISKATVVVTYLLPETHEKLKKKLKTELKRGVKVVAVGFKYRGWRPIAYDPRGGRYGGIYLYRI